MSAELQVKVGRRIVGQVQQGHGSSNETKWGQHQSVSCERLTLWLAAPHCLPPLLPDRLLVSSEAAATQTRSHQTLRAATFGAVHPDCQGLTVCNLTRSDLN